jgi:hypothetical protein
VLFLAKSRAVEAVVKATPSVVDARLSKADWAAPIATAEALRKSVSALLAVVTAADSALEVLILLSDVVAAAMALFWAVMVDARAEFAAETAALEAETARSRLSW